MVSAAVNRIYPHLHHTPFCRAVTRQRAGYSSAGVKKSEGGSREVVV